MVLANFSNFSYKCAIIYKYTHSSGNTSIIDMSSQFCSFEFMFEHGIFAHLTRIAIIEEITLPGMVAHVHLTNKRREKAENIINLTVESDDEFMVNTNTIETQATNEIQNNLPQQSNQITVANLKQPKKKRGRK